MGFVPWFVVGVSNGRICDLQSHKGRPEVPVYWAFLCAQELSGDAPCHSPVQQEQRGITQGPRASCAGG